jgi:hypothetical protein
VGVYSWRGLQRIKHGALLLWHTHELHRLLLLFGSVLRLLLLLRLLHHGLKTTVNHPLHCCNIRALRAYMPPPLLLLPLH